MVEDDVLQLEGIVDHSAGDVEARPHVDMPHQAPQQSGVRFWRVSNFKVQNHWVNKNATRLFLNDEVPKLFKLELS